MPLRNPLLAAEIVEQAPVGIFQTDEAGRCVYVNARWCAIAGSSREAALDRGWVRAIHPEDRERVLSEWEQAVRERRELVLEHRFQSGARTTWVVAHAVQLRDAEQRVLGYCGTSMDITTTKVAEEFAYRSTSESASESASSSSARDGPP